MGWASNYIEQLLTGATVQFRPRGNSMTGKIDSGQLVTIVPVNSACLEKNDIVLCKVNGRQYLHLIQAISNNRFKIGNAHGHTNGWIGESSIYGKCIRIED